MYADSYLLGSIRVGTYDETNTAGVNGVDLSAFGADLFGGTNPERSDFTNDLVTTVNGVDLSVLGSVLFSGRSNTSSAVLCP